MLEFHEIVAKANELSNAIKNADNMEVLPELHLKQFREISNYLDRMLYNLNPHYDAHPFITYNPVEKEELEKWLQGDATKFINGKTIVLEKADRDKMKLTLSQREHAYALQDLLNRTKLVIQELGNYTNIQVKFRETNVEIASPLEIKKEVVSPIKIQATSPLTAALKAKHKPMSPLSLGPSAEKVDSAQNSKTIKVSKRSSIFNFNIKPDDKKKKIPRYQKKDLNHLKRSNSNSQSIVGRKSCFIHRRTEGWVRAKDALWRYAIM